ncbi:MAG: hypothetical protein ABIB43_05960 [archaeon]
MNYEERTAKPQKECTSFYNQINKLGMNIYEITFEREILTRHKPQHIVETYTFLLPNKRLSKNNIDLLESYSNQFLTVGIPIKKMIAKEIKMNRVKESDFETLENLVNRGVHYKRR